MPPEKPLLTIAIPTYNRSRYLDELLQVLLPQVQNEPAVELLISDNASTDETPALCSRFGEDGLSYRYLRNEENIGADANFLRCFLEARGKYVWLLGDDDIVLPGALPKIVRLLGRSDYALAYLCPFPFWGDYEKERRVDRFGRFAQRVRNGLPFIREVGTTIAFISAMIVNKERLEAIEHPAFESFVGTNLVHLGWLLPALASGGDSLIVWERVLGARSANSAGWGIGEVFGRNLPRLTEAILGKSPEIAAELVNCTLGTWFPAMIAEIRRGTAGGLQVHDVRKILEPKFRPNWRYWLFVYPVAAFPRRAALVWYAGIKNLNRVTWLSKVVCSYPVWRRQLISRVP